MNIRSVISLVLALVFSVGAMAERGANPPGDPTLFSKDLSATNLPATYGAAANTWASALTGHSNVCAVSTVATKIYGTTSATANCTGGTDKFVIPPSGATCIERAKLNKYFCLRSSSGTLSSGVVDITIW